MEGRSQFGVDEESSGAVKPSRRVPSEPGVDSEKELGTVLWTAQSIQAKTRGERVNLLESPSR